MKRGPVAAVVCPHLRRLGPARAGAGRGLRQGRSRGAPARSRNANRRPGRFSALPARPAFSRAGAARRKSHTDRRQSTLSSPGTAAGAAWLADFGRSTAHGPRSTLHAQRSTLCPARRLHAAGLRSDTDVDVLVWFLQNQAGGQRLYRELYRYVLEPLLFYLALKRARTHPPAARAWLGERSFSIHVAHADGIAPVRYEPDHFREDRARYYLTELAADFLDPGCMDKLPLRKILERQDLRKAITAPQITARPVARTISGTARRCPGRGRRRQDLEPLGLAARRSGRCPGSRRRLRQGPPAFPARLLF